MKSIQRFVVLALIGNFFIAHLVDAQDQQGFISLDCGLPSNESSYTEQTTGLTFSSEAGYIQSGESGIIKIDNVDKYIKPYRYLRYFTEGIRNCYNLTVMQGTQYLIRAVFVYENYDGLKSRPKFDLFIGPNIWTTIDFQDLFYSLNMPGDGIMEEIIHMPKSKTLDICVVKTGTTTPFISTLELRPLRNDTYTTETGSLKLVLRTYLSTSESIIRYPGDLYDRYWTSTFWSDWTQINTTAAGNPPNAYKIPKAIITNYARPENSNDPLSMNWLNKKMTGQVYSYLHFAEMQTLRPNNTREFNILWNDNIMYSDYSPPAFTVDTVFFSQTCGIDYYCWLSFQKTKGSTFPPLLNAVELFILMPFLHADTDENDVIAIKNIQATYKINRISWQGDPCSPVQYMWHGLNCSSKTKLPSTPPRIILLDLSSSGLSGIVPSDIRDLTQLQKLDLSNNNLTGGIPEFLANLKSLTVINLSFNNLNGSIPRALRDMQKKGLLIVEGNPKLCTSPACESEGKYKIEWLVPVVASVSSLAVVSVAFILIFYIYRSKRKSKALRPSIVANKIRFTREEVISMTNSFERALGEGGFGVVYHGYLSGNKQVAVKVLSQSSAQGYKQFKAEIELLLRVHHINLVTLVGYCDERNHMALIYDYMPNGDLKQHLSGECATSSLSWARRLQIAAETAQGLEYLHIGCKPPMIHRDIKTMNILLDEHFQAKLGDFGLSRSFPIGSNNTHVSTNVAGSPGYLDPEYHKTNKLTEKSDVFSFGIVLLEIITSRSVIDQTREKPHIVEWVALMLTNGDIEKIVEPRLIGDYDSSSLWKALELAMSCVNPSTLERPNMSQVVVELKECLLNENLRKEGRSHEDSTESTRTGTALADP